MDPAIRRAIVFTWAGKCFYCGRSASDVDHIVPRSKQGIDDPVNLVACCEDCNRVKGALWLPLAVLVEALEAARKLAPFVRELAAAYKTALGAAMDRMNYGSVPLREGTQGRAFDQRASREMLAARDLHSAATEIAQQFDVQKRP